MEQQQSPKCEEEKQSYKFHSELPMDNLTLHHWCLFWLSKIVLRKKLTEIFPLKKINLTRRNFPVKYGLFIWKFKISKMMERIHTE